jgi:hypothetical protein
MRQGMRIARYLSSYVSKQSVAVPQGGSMLLDLQQHQQSNLVVKSAWQDHCEIEGSDINLTTDLSQNLFSLHATSSTASNIVITIPEMFNMKIRGSHLELQLQNKVLMVTMRS